MKKFFYSIAFAFALSLTWNVIVPEISLALVQIDPSLKPEGLPSINVAKPSGQNNGKIQAIQSVASFVGAFVNRALIFLSSVAIILIIIAGANYSFSFGNPDRAENGKRGLIWSLIGLLVILFSYAIVQGILQIILMLA